MKAIVQRAYGSPEHVLELRDDVEKPALEEDRVLVRVRAASVNSGDWRRVRADPFIIRLLEGLRRPRKVVVGVDAAGIVEAVGPAVDQVAPGDAVYGFGGGTFAEYTVGRSLVPMPANLTFEEAACVPAAGCTALQALRDRGNVRPGQTVLINGAGGGVGTFAVQIAKALGAEVTAVTSTDKLAAVGAIGADDVVDYNRQDFTRSGRRYDVIVDCAGNRSVADFRRALTADGTLVLVGAGKGPFAALGRLLGSQVRRRLLKQPVVNFIASGPFNENLLTLKALIEAGKVRPVIDRTYPLAGTPDAIAYAETQQVRGKVVITVSEAGS